MGFLSGLFHSRDKPTNSTNGSAYRFLFGGSNSGKAVNERSAMQMTAVYACVRILSDSIAGLPVHVYKYTDSGSKEKAIKHPLYRLIHDEPKSGNDVLCLPRDFDDASSPLWKCLRANYTKWQR